jgi:hypothetical protein
MRPGQRFEARVLRARRLTPTTFGIEVEKPAGFTFRRTQFTFLQVETPEGVDRLYADLELSGREDLNLRPFGPEPNALPGCATPRMSE